MKSNAIKSTAQKPAAQTLSAHALRFSAYLFAAAALWYPAGAEALSFACPHYFATRDAGVGHLEAPTLWGVSSRMAPVPSNDPEATVFRGHFQGRDASLTVRMDHQMGMTRYPVNRRFISGDYGGPTELEVSDATIGGPRLIAGNVMGFRMRVVTSTGPDGRSNLSGHITREQRNSSGLFASWFEATPTASVNVRRVLGRLDEFQIDVLEHRTPTGDIRLVGKLGDEAVDIVVPSASISPLNGFLMGGLLGPVLSPELSRYPDLMWYALLAMARARR